MNEDIVYCTVKEGKISNFKLLTETLLSFDGNIEVIIRKKRKGRSTQQNRWYWACVTILSKHTGYTRDEMHEIIKYKFLKKERIHESTGEVFEYIGHTSQLTTTEFSEFIESFIMWAGQTLACTLPYPEQQVNLQIQ